MRLFIYAAFFALCAAPAALSAQLVSVPQTQRAVIVKKTADWCPLCGGWGWPVFANLLADNGDRATLIAAHHSGGLTNPVAQSLAYNLEGPSQPRFYVNNTDLNANSSNGATVRANANAMVESMAQQTPLVQTGIKASYLNNQLFIETSTQLFQNWAGGELYLGIYLIERTVIANQASQGANAEHKQILRSVVKGQWYGVQLLNEATPAGYFVDSRDTVALGAILPQNLEVATILWRRNGTEYEVVNTNFTRDITEAVVVSVENPVFPGVGWVVANNRIQSGSMSVISLSQSHKQVSLGLYTMSGQFLKYYYDGSLGAGRYEFSLEDLIGFPAGVYLLQLKVDGQLNAQRIIVP
jgi:hypothetical protein